MIRAGARSPNATAASATQPSRTLADLVSLGSPIVHQDRVFRRRARPVALPRPQPLSLRVPDGSQRSGDARLRYTHHFTPSASHQGASATASSIESAWPSIQALRDPLLGKLCIFWAWAAVYARDVGREIRPAQARQRGGCPGQARRLLEVALDDGQGSEAVEHDRHALTRPPRSRRAGGSPRTGRGLSPDRPTGWPSSRAE